MIEKPDFGMGVMVTTIVLGLALAAFVVGGAEGIKQGHRHCALHDPQWTKECSTP
jgi:hypothetical protein